MYIYKNIFVNFEVKTFLNLNCLPKLLSFLHIAIQYRYSLLKVIKNMYIVYSTSKEQRDDNVFHFKGENDNCEILPFS